jgi:hypothetical protein
VVAVFFENYEPLYPLISRHLDPGHGFPVLAYPYRFEPFPIRLQTLASHIHKQIVTLSQNGNTAMKRNSIFSFMTHYTILFSDPAKRVNAFQ